VEGLSPEMEEETSPIWGFFVSLRKRGRSQEGGMKISLIRY
jgi:hypothetical protein